MTITDQLPTMELQDLRILLENATRLQDEPGQRAAQAVELIPLIQAQIATRPTTTAVAKPRARAKKVAA